MLWRLRYFQRGIVGLCRSTVFKVTSSQSWSFERYSVAQLESNHSPAAQVRVLELDYAQSLIDRNFAAL